MLKNKLRDVIRYKIFSYFFNFYHGKNFFRGEEKKMKDTSTYKNENEILVVKNLLLYKTASLWFKKRKSETSGKRDATHRLTGSEGMPSCFAMLSDK